MGKGHALVQALKSATCGGGGGGADELPHRLRRHEVPMEITKHIVSRVSSTVRRSGGDSRRPGPKRYAERVRHAPRTELVPRCCRKVILTSPSRTQSSHLLARRDELNGRRQVVDSS